jgi:hypothetical protein
MGKAMNSNLPMGADNSSIAPWNQVDDLCRYCDQDIIRGMAQEAVLDESDTDEYMEALLEEAGLCKDCFKEEQADDDDDWCNWKS